MEKKGVLNEDVIEYIHEFIDPCSPEYYLSSKGNNLAAKKYILKKLMNYPANVPHSGSPTYVYDRAIRSIARLNKQFKKSVTDVRFIIFEKLLRSTQKGALISVLKDVIDEEDRKWHRVGKDKEDRIILRITISNPEQTQDELIKRYMRMYNFDVTYDGVNAVINLMEKFSQYYDSSHSIYLWTEKFLEQFPIPILCAVYKEWIASDRK